MSLWGDQSHARQRGNSDVELKYNVLKALRNLPEGVAGAALSALVNFAEATVAGLLSRSNTTSHAARSAQPASSTTVNDSKGRGQDKGGGKGTGRQAGKGKDAGKDAKAPYGEAR